MEKCERIRRMKQCIAEKFDLRLILDEYSWIIIQEIAETTNVPIHYIQYSQKVPLPLEIYLNLNHLGSYYYCT